MPLEVAGLSLAIQSWPFKVAETRTYSSHPLHDTYVDKLFQSLIFLSITGQDESSSWSCCEGGFCEAQSPFGFPGGPFQRKIGAKKKNREEHQKNKSKSKPEVSESGVSFVSKSFHQFSDCFCVFEIEVMNARV